MGHTTSDYDGIVDFWDWYRRRKSGKSNPLASYALNKCEETFRKCDWNSFGYWHAIYLRERQNRHPPTGGDQIDERSG